MDLLKGLNEKQKEAILHQEGPLLVVAGAGAGKTRVITHRVAYLIQNGIKPTEILAVTFTNKAADEMKERITKLVSPAYRQAGSDLNSSEGGPLAMPTVGTFHSVCARILRENSRAIGLPRAFSILDQEDSLKIIKNCLKTLEINPKQFQPQKIQSIISSQKSKLIKSEDFSREAGEDFFPKIVASIWTEYEKSLTKQKSLDFDDLIAKTVFLFEDRPEILEKYQNKWQYILIDEYQDTNHSQYVLTKLLAQKYKNICAVGDEDQSIYRFRGADFGNILNFEKDWSCPAGGPGVKTVILEQNYRSTQKILDAANAVIGKNKSRKPKNLFSLLAPGEKITLFDASSEKDEADFVAATSKEIIKSGSKPSDIAVFYRANFQSRVLEESFLRHDIPYQIIGTKFFERKEIKDIMAYIKAALNPDDILSLERIINEPPRGLGKSSLLNHLAGHPSTSLRAKKIKEFFDFLKKTKEILQQESLSKSLTFIIKESGYQKYLNDGSEEGLTRLDNLKELIGLSHKYDTLKPPLGAEQLLEDAALVAEQDTIEKKSKVRLMTVHAAKGLEFPCTFVTGMEEGLFPFFRFGERMEEEEERRLFYVALTRAKEKVFLSFSYSRSFFGSRQINKPSRFINEIPQDLFDNFEITTTNYLEL